MHINLITMAETILTLDFLKNEMQSMDQILGHDWKSKNRQSLIQFLNSSINHVKEIEKRMWTLQEDFEKNPGVHNLQLKNHISANQQMLDVLKRNLELEENKRIKNSEMQELTIIPDLFDAIQSRLLELMQSNHQAIEKVQIHIRKENLPSTGGRSMERNIMDLLHSKEDEIQILKSQMNELKKESALGRLMKVDVSEMERELIELDKKFHLERNGFEQTVKGFRGQMDEMMEKQAIMENSFNKVEHFMQLSSHKNLELVKELKKERDYAKKLALEIGKETEGLRTKYSHELLNFEEGKMKVKAQERQKVEGEISELKEQLKEKREMLQHFQKIAQDQERRISKMEDELKQKK